MRNPNSESGKKQNRLVFSCISKVCAESTHEHHFSMQQKTAHCAIRPRGTEDDGQRREFPLAALVLHLMTSDECGVAWCLG